MQHRFEGERTLMRIYIGENDRARHGPYAGKALHEALLLTFRERGFAGATVLRAIAGFGASARPHIDRVLRLSLDLPIVVEVVETEERIRGILPELDRLIDGGLVTLERAHVILYRPAREADEERWERRAEGLTPAPDEATEGS